MKKVAFVSLFCLLVNACALPSPARAEAGEAADFRFVVMGDNRPFWDAEDVVTQNEHFIGNIQRTNAAGADFAVIVGDLIHGYTDDAELIDRQWNAYDAVCKRFEIPYYSVAGNHDIWDRRSQDVWLERLGPLYFSWDHKGSHFIALNSEVVGEMDRITGAQLEWLKQDLEEAKAAPRIFVFVHKPLWAYEAAESEEQNQWSRDVHPLLAGHGVDTVFAGHWHHYTLHPEQDGVRYVVTGGAGAEIGGYELAGGFFHVLTVDVDGPSSSFKVLTERGEMPADCVTTEKVRGLWAALTVEPLEDWPEDGSVTIPVRIRNPIQKEVTAVVQWDTSDTTWQAETAEFTIPAGATKELAIRAKAGERIYPLPKGGLELVDGDRKLFGWDIHQRAFARIGRFISEWNVAGPFDLGLTDATEEERSDDDRYLNAHLKGWDDPLPPERDLDLSAAYAGKRGEEVRWRIVAADQAGLVDLDALYEEEDYAVACAVAYVYAPKGGSYQMTVGSDDSVLVRINGRQVWRAHALRAAVPDEDVFDADLQAGWNEVFLKVAERSGGWGFYLRVVDPRGELRFAVAAE